jgi:hypothetical protein
MSMTTSHRISLPRLLLHLEGAAILGLAIFLYAKNGESWWWFLLLLLAPDLSMIGYAAGTKIGALTYNLAHSYVAPVIIAIIGVQIGEPLIVGISLIWFAHIGLDRMIGYGLKYPTDFKDTHLAHV